MSVRNMIYHIVTTQQLGLLQWGRGRRYGPGLIKIMEWNSALAEQVLGRSSNSNEFWATVIKLSSGSGSEGTTARKETVKEKVTLLKEGLTLWSDC